MLATPINIIHTIFKENKQSTFVMYLFSQSAILDRILTDIVNKVVNV